jgi:hypothetical protein
MQRLEWLSQMDEVLRFRLGSRVSRSYQPYLSKIARGTICFRVVQPPKRDQPDHTAAFKNSPVDALRHGVVLCPALDARGSRLSWHVPATASDSESTGATHR